jgi:6-phosphogluconolactonase
MADTGDDLLKAKSESREILPGVRVYPNPAEVARAAARLFVDYAWQAISRYGRFMVALSGGNTPRAMFQLLASAEFRGQVDWAKVHVFWSDERAVPPDHLDSNYGMARRELLLRVPIPPANVHRMEAEEAVIGRAAHAYESALRRHLPLDDRGFPIFDLVLLGLGPDGHTASLFPGSRLLRETSRWVSTPMVSKLGMRRMSLTMPVLEAARRVLFLVAGAEKTAILHEVLCVPRPHPLPAQMVVPRNGERTFLVDEAAASLLPCDAEPPLSPTKGAKPGAARSEGKKP